MMKTLHGLDVNELLLSAVTIDREDMQGEFVAVPAHLAYFNELYAEAMRDWMEAKARLDEAVAEAGLRIRESLLDAIADGSIKAPRGVTEAMVEPRVTTDPQVMGARDLVIQTEVSKIRLHGVLDAIRAKREMLISLGATMRAELRPDPSLNY